MKQSAKTTVIPKSSNYQESDLRFSMLHQLTEADYYVSGTHVYCWLCRTEPEVSDGSYPIFENAYPWICIYSAPCGLIRLRFTNHSAAEEVFSLVTRYEVSPYHVEDILEDRDISFTLQYL